MTQKQMPRAFLIVTKTTKANDNKLFKLAVINRSLSHHLWHKHTGSLYVLMYSGMPISNPWVAIILLNCQDLNVVPNFSCLEKSTMTYFLLIFFFYLFFFISWAQVVSVGEAVTGGSRQLEEVHNSLMVGP